MQGCIHVQVTSPSNRVMYEGSGESEGRFAFTTAETGDYKACFTARGMPDHAHLLAIGRNVRLPSS